MPSAPGGVLPSPLVVGKKRVEIPQGKTPFSAQHGPPGAGGPPGGGGLDPNDARKTLPSQGRVPSSGSGASGYVPYQRPGSSGQAAPGGGGEDFYRGAY